MMMTSTFRRHAANGFTLIELLIVVIIIAILAAIAIPQFSNTSSDAQESAAIANLTSMRSAIELYRVQHNNTYPAVKTSGGGSGCTGGTAGDGDAGSSEAFVDQLTKYSNATGQTCSVAAAGYIYGPYLRAIPVEPITNAADVVVAANATTNAAGADTKGWRYETGANALTINSTKTARDNKAYNLK